MERSSAKRRIDVCRIVSVVITLGFIACGVFVFPNAICRLAESVRDVGVSFAYYFMQMIFSKEIAVTVNQMPAWQIVPSRFAPLTLIPFTWEEFSTKMSAYWSVFASTETLEEYWLFVSDLLYYVSQLLLILSTLLLPFYILFQNYLRTHNNDYDKDTKSVRILKRISDLTWRKIKFAIGYYVTYLKTQKVYLKVWCWLWAFYFNWLTIGLEFVAFYLYFVFSFDFISIYAQVYKLLLDITAMIRFIPGVVWFVLVVWGLDRFSRSIGYRELNHREHRNGGYVEERGVVTVVYGPMGAGKTKFITDMALTEEVRLRNMAFDIIVQSDFKFPNMNWARLEQKLKKKIRKHEVYSTPTVRRWLWAKYEKWKENPNLVKIFGYDYERYGLTYNDGLKIQSVWEVIDDYACAFFMYMVQSSYIQANYSIRSDNVMEDVGNFPIWNTDFFKRDPRLMASYSKHAHILDYDMLRLGKTLLKNNPNRYAFGFGVYVISEIDKERKNSPELQGVQKDAEEANQKNDLFNTMLKMSRHACVVANRVFIKIFADLQRPESLGADARELGEITYIQDPGEMQPILPFFAPFYFFQAFYNILFGGFVDLYYDYRFIRSDKTLPMYILKNFVAKLAHYNERTCNTFGSSTMKILVESGRMNGEGVKERKYFMQSKKIYSNRYTTNCLNGIFERFAELNTIGLDDLPEYATELASDEELLRQNSFFQMEVRGYTRQAA